MKYIEFMLVIYNFLTIRSEQLRLDVCSVLVLFTL